MPSLRRRDPPHNVCGRDSFEPRRERGWAMSTGRFPTRTELTADLCCREADGLFEDGRARHSALDEHATIWTVLGVLSNEDSGWDRREPLVRALVAEYQLRVHRFWSAALVAAFTPMLVRLVRAQRCPAGLLDDLRAESLHAFLYAASRLDLIRRPTMTAKYLKEHTRERMRTFANRERRFAARHEAILGVEFVGAGRDGLLGESVAPDVGREVRARLLAGFIAVNADPEIFDILVAETMGEALRDVVRQRHPDADPVEQERIYQRTKKRYHRAVRALRELLDKERVPDLRLAPPFLVEGPTWRMNVTTNDTRQAVTESVREIALALTGLFEVHGAPPELIAGAADVLRKIHAHQLRRVEAVRAVDDRRPSAMRALVSDIDAVLAAG